MWLLGPVAYGARRWFAALWWRRDNPEHEPEPFA